MARQWRPTHQSFMHRGIPVLEVSSFTKSGIENFYCYFRKVKSSGENACPSVGQHGKPLFSRHRLCSDAPATFAQTGRFLFFINCQILFVMFLLIVTYN